MQMHVIQLPVDGRQSETAFAVARGTGRLLLSLGFYCVSELPLPSGRRADASAASAALRPFVSVASRAASASASKISGAERP